MKIAVIGAMDVEVENLKTTLNLKKEDNNDIYVGIFCNKEIILSKSGIGKVNSAANTQYIIDKYMPNYIINTGCAGSLTDKLKVMDTVISSFVTYHDFTPIRIMKYSTPDDGNIKADEKLISITEDILKKENINYYVSPITSGDCFVTDSKVRDEIYNRTKATIVDMESASIGHISRKNNVPFICIRTVSDFADGNDDFEKEAGERSTEIVKKIIENL